MQLTTVLLLITTWWINVDKNFCACTDGVIFCFANCCESTAPPRPFPWKHWYYIIRHTGSGHLRTAIAAGKKFVYFARFVFFWPPKFVFSYTILVSIWSLYPFVYICECRHLVMWQNLSEYQEIIGEEKLKNFNLLMQTKTSIY